MPTVTTYDQNKGCPLCGEMPIVKPVTFRSGKAVAYPTLLYHWEQKHKGMPVPPPTQDRTHVGGKPEGEPVGNDMPDDAWLAEIREAAYLELHPKPIKV